MPEKNAYKKGRYPQKLTFADNSRLLIFCPVRPFLCFGNKEIIFDEAFRFTVHSLTQLRKA